jgi:hypothetical protein
MKKVKGKSETAAKATTKKDSKATKPVDLVEVRKDVTNIVGNEAIILTQAVVEEAKKGQLAPVKYLFEMAGIYPAPVESSAVKPEENSLARTLMHRLGLPEEFPIPSGDDMPEAQIPRAGKKRAAAESDAEDNEGTESQTAGAEVANEDEIRAATDVGPVE